MIRFSMVACHLGAVPGEHSLSLAVVVTASAFGLSLVQVSAVQEAERWAVPTRGILVYRVR
jgi:hypothetical protein